MIELIKQLRAVEVARHQKVMGAIAALEASLDESPAIASVRAKVMSTLRKESLIDVEGIQSHFPELSKKQIWGVLAAADLKEVIESAKIPGGRVGYRMKT
jgi:hypothetical protein